MSGGFWGKETVDKLLSRLGQQVASYDVFSAGVDEDLVSGVQVDFRFPVMTDTGLIFLKLITGSIEFFGSGERVVDFLNPFTLAALSFVMSVDGAEYFDCRFNNFENGSVKVFGDFPDTESRRVSFIAIGSDDA